MKTNEKMKNTAKKKIQQSPAPAHATFAAPPASDVKALRLKLCERHHATRGRVFANVRMSSSSSGSTVSLYDFCRGVSMAGINPVPTTDEMIDLFHSFFTPSSPRISWNEIIRNLEKDASTAALQRIQKKGEARAASALNRRDKERQIAAAAVAAVAAAGTTVTAAVAQIENEEEEVVEEEEEEEKGECLECKKRGDRELMPLSSENNASASAAATTAAAAAAAADTPSFSSAAPELAEKAAGAAVEAAIIAAEKAAAALAQKPRKRRVRIRLESELQELRLALPSLLRAEEEALQHSLKQTVEAYDDELEHVALRAAEATWPKQRRAALPGPGMDAAKLQTLQNKLKAKCYSMGGKNFEAEFGYLDLDRDGVMPIDEITAWLRRLVPLSNKELHCILRILDSDLEGGVSWHELKRFAEYGKGEVARLARGGAVTRSQPQLQATLVGLPAEIFIATLTSAGDFFDPWRDRQLEALIEQRASDEKGHQLLEEQRAEFARKQKGWKREGRKKVVAGREELSEEHKKKLLLHSRRIRQARTAAELAEEKLSESKGEVAGMLAKQQDTFRAEIAELAREQDEAARKSAAEEAKEQAAMREWEHSAELEAEQAAASFRTALVHARGMALAQLRHEQEQAATRTAHLIEDALAVRRDVASVTEELTKTLRLRALAAAEMIRQRARPAAEALDRASNIKAIPLEKLLRLRQKIKADQYGAGSSSRGSSSSSVRDDVILSRAEFAHQVRRLVPWSSSDMKSLLRIFGADSLGRVPAGALGRFAAYDREKIARLSYFASQGQCSGHARGKYNSLQGVRRDTTLRRALAALSCGEFDAANHMLTALTEEMSRIEAPSSPSSEGGIAAAKFADLGASHLMEEADAAARARDKRLRAAARKRISSRSHSHSHSHGNGGDGGGDESGGGVPPRTTCAQRKAHWTVRTRRTPSLQIRT